MRCRGIFVVVALLLFVSVFVFAAVSAPTDLEINENVSALYDEGSFSVNWTPGGADAESNYSIYIHADGVLFNISLNDSETGFHFSNTTEANYTFYVEALNATGDSANSTNVSVYVDTTGPVVTLPNYVNGTFSKNTDMLTLNISVVDALSGEVGSECLIDVNGTNQSVAVSDGWCNSSAINLTALSDGNNTISVWVNDTVNNLALNNSFVIDVDTTAPTAVGTCTPTSVLVAERVSCSCGGNDAGSGINSTLTTGASTPSTLIVGTYTYTCSVTDNAGNSNSHEVTYSVGASGSSTSSSGSPVYTPTDDKLADGYTIFLAENYKVSFDVNNGEHVLKVNDVSDTSVSITLSSDPVTFNLNVGETKKVDLDSDGYYDVSVFLKEIKNGKANIVLTSIKELASEEEVSVVEENITTTTGIKDKIEETMEKTIGDNNGIFWSIVAVLVLVVLVLIIYNKSKKKVKKKAKKK